MAASRARGVIADEALPSLGLLWDAGALTDVINSKVAPVLFGGRRAAGVTMGHQIYRPLRQLFAWCEVLMADAGADTGAIERLIISMGKERRGEAAFRKHYERRPDGRAVYVDEHDSLFEAFPHDHRLRGMPRLFNPARLNQLLAAAGIDPGVEERGRPVVLNYRPHEACVVEVPGITLPGGLPLVAKATHDPKRTERFFRASRALRSSLSGPAWTPQTFRPAGDPNVLFMEKAPGAAAFDHPDIEEAVMLAASAMAAYHGTSVRLGARNAYTIPFGIEHAWSRTRRVRLVAPLLAARGEEVLHRLEEQADDVSAAHVFVHSDFKGSQLLIGDGRVAVVDLDSSRLGDPAVDAGGFLADMRKEAVLRGRDELRTFDDAFLRASVARHPSGRGLERRARVFRVVALVRMAMHAFRQDPGGYSEDDETYTAHALLNEAEECLRDL